MLRALLRTLGLLYALALTAYLSLRFAVADIPPWLALAHTFLPYYFVPLPLFLLLALLGRGRVVTLWLTGLGVLATAWFAPFFVPKPAPQLEADLTLVTYNMKRETLELTPWLRETDADVVFLQEIPLNARYFDTLTEDLADLYPYTLAQRPGWGNAILSRYPLNNTATIVSWGGTPPQRAEVELDGQQVTLYNVHLKNPLNRSRELAVFDQRIRSGYDNAGRNAQLARLISLLQGAPPHFVVAGDFNMSEYDLIYEDLTRVASDSFREVGVGLGNTWPDARKFGVVPDVLPPLLRLDYIWYGSGFKALGAVRELPLGSDHYPVKATLVFNDAVQNDDMRVALEAR